MDITFTQETIIRALEKELHIKINPKQVKFFKDKDNKQRVKILLKENGVK